MEVLQIVLARTTYFDNFRSHLATKVEPVS
jgi:hypothetical protein